MRSQVRVMLSPRLNRGPSSSRRFRFRNSYRPVIVFRILVVVILGQGSIINKVQNYSRHVERATIEYSSAFPQRRLAREAMKFKEKEACFYVRLCRKIIIS